MISVPYEVKKALRDGMLRKNYRFVVLNDDGTEDFTIDNDTLVSESVIIDERMCSGDKLKFGLCEGSSLEFQYFNHPNITGRRVQVFIDVFYTDQDYEAIAELEPNGAHYITQEACSYLFTVPANTTGAVIRKRENTTVTWRWYLSDRPQQTDFYGRVGDDFYVTSDTSGFSITMSKEVFPYSLPMGFFDVKKCSRQASTGIMKVTAYNKLMSDYLEAKANQEIIDIVSQGEEGNSTVSFYWILDKLLKDYSIEKYETSTLYPDITDQELDSDGGLENWRQAHAGQALDICFTLYNSSHSTTGNYLHVCAFSFNMGGFNGQYEYYAKFLFNHLVGPYITDSVYKGLGASALDSNYLASYDLEPRQYKSLRDFLLNGSWETFWAIGGGGANLFDTQKKMVGGLVDKDGSYLIKLTTDYETDIHYVSNASNVNVFLPYRAVITNSTTSVTSSTDYKTYFRPFHHAVEWMYKSIELNIPESAMQRITLEQAEKFGDVTLRDIQSAVYETVCQFGQLSRITDLFSGVELNYGGLYPADDLYPANDLYPGGAPISASKSMYNKLWADEGNVHKWRYLIITYKGLDEEQNEKDYTLQRTVNADGTDDYNMSDNWLFRNLIWTAEQVGDYADAMVAKMQDVTWFPFEMWCAGLPYLETGDEIEIPLNGESYTSYVLQRQLKGIQNLQDTYINGTLDIF